MCHICQTQYFSLMNGRRSFEVRREDANLPSSPSASSTSSYAVARLFFAIPINGLFSYRSRFSLRSFSSFGNEPCINEHFEQPNRREMKERLSSRGSNSIPMLCRLPLRHTLTDEILRRLSSPSNPRNRQKENANATLSMQCKRWRVNTDTWSMEFVREERKRSADDRQWRWSPSCTEDVSQRDALNLPLMIVNGRYLSRIMAT